MTFIYSYGTLRPGDGLTIKIPGSIYDLGWFPGFKFEGDGQVTCEKIEVEDLAAVDRYEGFNEAYPDESLFRRVPLLDGFIYVFNRSVNPIKKVESGDWLDYTREKRGINGGRFGRSSR